MITLIIIGIFSSIKAWVVTTVGGAAIGIGAKVAQKKGWTLKLNALAKISSKYLRKLSVLLMRSASTVDEMAEVSEKVDESIDDITGEFNTKQKDEIIKEAKDVVSSGENIIEGVKSFKE